MDKMITKVPMVRFTNRFALQARIGFTKARQLRLAVGTISQIDPFDENAPMDGFLPMEAMESFAASENGKPSKNITKDIKKLVGDMMTSNYVQYPSKIEYKGEQLDGYRVFFERFTPQEKDGQKGYYYRIHEDMRPDLKGLVGDYTTFRLSKKIRSGTAIRFSMLVTAHHNKVRAFQNVSKLKISLQELRRILALENKYPVFSDFRKRVIEQVVGDVNKSGFLQINYEFVRTGREITHIIFHTQDGDLASVKQIEVDSKSATSKTKNYKDYVPTDKDISKLSKAQLAAYHYLIERKCKEGIAYRRIVLNLPSNEFEGWEDVYIKKAWERFEKTTKYKQPKRKAGAFVIWWRNGEFRDRLFAEMMEEVLAIKKSKNPEQYRNREVAKQMTASQFNEWWNAQQQQKMNNPNQDPNPIRTNSGMERIGDVLKSRYSGDSSNE